MNKKFKDIIIKSNKNFINTYLKSTYKLYLVTNNVDGKEICAIFNSKLKAKKFILRNSINFSVQIINDNTIKEIVNFEQYFNEYVNNMIYFYEIEEINHLDISMPIYVNQSGNYRVYGNPTEYLTNSLDYWKENNDFYKKYDSNYEEWIKQCTVLINPSLKEIQYPI